MPSVMMGAIFWDRAAVKFSLVSKITLPVPGHGFRLHHVHHHPPADLRGENRPGDNARQKQRGQIKADFPFAHNLRDDLMF